MRKRCISKIDAKVRITKVIVTGKPTADPKKSIYRLTYDSDRIAIDRNDNQFRDKFRNQQICEYVVNGQLASHIELSNAASE